MDVWEDVYVCGWMDRWMNMWGRINGWICMNEWRCGYGCAWWDG